MDNKNISASKVYWTPPLLMKLLRAIVELPKTSIKWNFPALRPFSSLFNPSNGGKPFPFLSFSMSSALLPKLKRSTAQNQHSSYEGSFNEGRSRRSEKGPVHPRLNNFYKRGDSAARRESLEFMKRLMDHFTHLSNFEKPVDPELATVISARLPTFTI